MIRLIIILMFFFILWVFFASGMPRKRKIIVGIIAVMACALAIWVDGYDKREHTNLVNTENVVICGVSAAHSYRSNYDIEICLKNTASKGTLSRVNIAIIASSCEQECVELERVKRDARVSIAPGTQIMHKENLAFDEVDPSREHIQWSAQILNTKARK